jgi:hypothetical protein
VHGVDGNPPHRALSRPARRRLTETAAQAQRIRQMESEVAARDEKIAVEQHLAAIQRELTLATSLR